MKISTILDHIDSGFIALPEFQRGYVWNRDQVRAFMDSLYRRHPVGSLLVWATRSDEATHRGDGRLAPEVVKLLLDGQQRMTSLYGIVRGKPPRFFDGNEKTFTGLRFHLEREEFAFYSPVYMKDDPLWIDVSAVMREGNDGIGGHLTRLSSRAEHAPKIGVYLGRLSQILGIRDVSLHVEEVTGEDKTIEVVVDIFELADPDTGDPIAIFDLAWEKGLQEGLSDPVALLLDEPPATLALANAHGFRYFTGIDAFKRYVETEILAIREPVAAAASG